MYQDVRTSWYPSLYRRVPRCGKSNEIGGYQSRKTTRERGHQDKGSTDGKNGQGGMGGARGEGGG